MKLSYLFLLPVVGLSLGACSSSKEVLPPCPQVVIVRALETYNDYGSDTPNPVNLVAVGKMDKVVGTCQYNDEGIDIQFILSMRALKEERLGGDQVTMPYFVSVVDAEDKIESKEFMSASFKFKDTPIASFQEELRVFIPYVGDKKATNSRVLIGFQLTQEQRLLQLREAERKMKR